MSWNGPRCTRAIRDIDGEDNGPPILFPLNRAGLEEGTNRVFETS